MRRLLGPEVPFPPRRLPVYYGWVVVFATTVGVLCSIPGQSIGVSAFTDPVLGATGLSRLEFSGAYLAGTLCSAICLPFAGQFIDRHGVRAGALCAALLLAATMFGLAEVDTLAARLARPLGLEPETLTPVCLAALFFGLRFSGQGVLTLASHTMLARWFSRRRGLAVAISSTTIAFGFSASPRLLANWIDATGWRGAWQQMAWVEIAGMATFAWLMYRESPESCGLTLDGARPPAEAREAETAEEPDSTRGEALRTGAFWSLALAIATYGMMITGITLHIEDLGHEAGLTRDQSLSLFVPMAVMSTAVGAVTGWLADRCRIRHLVLALLAAESLGFFAVAHLDGPGGAGYWLAIAALGACSGLFTVLQTAGLPRFFGRKHLASIAGVSMSLVVVGTAVGPTALAWSRSFTGSYRPGLYAAAAVPVLLAGLALRARHPRDQPRVRRRGSD